MKRVYSCFLTFSTTSSGWGHFHESYYLCINGTYPPLFFSGSLKSPWSRRKRKHTLSRRHWKSLFASDGRFLDGGVKFLKRVCSGVSILETKLTLAIVYLRSLFLSNDFFPVPFNLTTFVSHRVLNQASEQRSGLSSLQCKIFWYLYSSTPSPCFVSELFVFLIIKKFGLLLSYFSAISH